MAVFGLPALRFLYTTDRDERQLLVALAMRALVVEETRQRNLATRISNAIVKSRA